MEKNECKPLRRKGAEKMQLDIFTAEARRRRDFVYWLLSVSPSPRLNTLKISLRLSASAVIKTNNEKIYIQRTIG